MIGNNSIEPKIIPNLACCDVTRLDRSPTGTMNVVVKTKVTIAWTSMLIFCLEKRRMSGFFVDWRCSSVASQFWRLLLALYIFYQMGYYYLESMTAEPVYQILYESVEGRWLLIREDDEVVFPLRECDLRRDYRFLVPEVVNQAPVIPIRGFGVPPRFALA